MNGLDLGLPRENVFAVFGEVKKSETILCMPHYMQKQAEQMMRKVYDDYVDKDDVTICQSIITAHNEAYRLSNIHRATRLIGAVMPVLNGAAAFSSGLLMIDGMQLLDFAPYAFTLSVTGVTVIVGMLSQAKSAMCTVAVVTLEAMAGGRQNVIAAIELLQEKINEDGIADCGDPNYPVHAAKRTVA